MWTRRNILIFARVSHYDHICGTSKRFPFGILFLSLTYLSIMTEELVYISTGNFDIFSIDRISKSLKNS